MFEFIKEFVLFFILLCVSQVIVFAQSDYQRTDLWEKEIAALVRIDKSEFPKKSSVLFVGSSSVRMWKNLAQDFRDFSTINRGFGGSQLEDVNFYAPQIVLPYKPKLIVLYAGENDINDGKTPETILEDFNKFVSIVHKNLPKTRIIFISLKPSPSRWNFAAKFQEANRLIKAATEKDKRLLFVDVWEKMLNKSGEPRKDIFQVDELHMNSAGYEIWRETLLPQIKRGLRKDFR